MKLSKENFDHLYFIQNKVLKIASDRTPMVLMVYREFDVHPDDRHVMWWDFGEDRMMYLVYGYWNETEGFCEIARYDGESVTIELPYRELPGTDHLGATLKFVWNTVVSGDQGGWRDIWYAWFSGSEEGAVEAATERLIAQRG